MRAPLSGLFALAVVAHAAAPASAQHAAAESEPLRTLANNLYTVASSPGKISARLAAIDALAALGAKSSTASQNLVRLLGYKKGGKADFDPTDAKQVPAEEQSIFLLHVVQGLGGVGPAAGVTVADAIPGLIALKDRDSVLDVAIDAALAALMKDLSVLSPQSKAGHGPPADPVAAVKTAANALRPKDPKNPTADELRNLAAILGDDALDPGVRLLAAKYVPTTVKFDDATKPVVLAAAQKAAASADAELKAVATALAAAIGK